MPKQYHGPIRNNQRRRHNRGIRKTYDLYGERHGETDSSASLIRRLNRGDYNAVALEDPPGYGNDDAFVSISKGNYSEQRINRRWSSNSDKGTRRILRKILRTNQQVDRRDRIQVFGWKEHSNSDNYTGYRDNSEDEHHARSLDRRISDYCSDNSQVAVLAGNAHLYGLGDELSRRGHDVYAVASRDGREEHGRDVMARNVNRLFL